MIRVWDLRHGKTDNVATVEVPTATFATWALAELPDGRIAATTETTERCIRIWRLLAGGGAALDAELSPHPLRVGGVSCSSNCPLFLTVLSDGRMVRVLPDSHRIDVWTPSSDGRLWTLEEMQQPDLPNALKVPASRVTITSVCADRFGRRIVGYDITVSWYGGYHEFGAFSLWRHERGVGIKGEYCTCLSPEPVITLLPLRSGKLLAIHRRGTRSADATMRK